MAIKVIAQRRELKIGKNPGVKKFVMRPDLYISLHEKKVFSEAATRSGISVGVLKAAWDAAGEVIRAWATEGHSVPLPGLGTMRFGVRSKAVEELEKVKTSLITTRRIIFTPSVDVKDELKNTSIQITCLDEDGTVLKRVTSDDEGDIEDNEDENENENQNENQNQGGSGSSGSGNSGDSGNSGNSGSQTPTIPTLTISRSGSGSSAVTVGGNAVNSGSQIAAGTEVALSITPAAGQTPTATLNGSSVTLTESDGTYTGTFQMPDGNATLVINSGSTGGGGVDQN